MVKKHNHATALVPRLEKLSDEHLAATFVLYKVTQFIPHDIGEFSGVFRNLTKLNY